MKAKLPIQTQPFRFSFHSQRRGLPSNRSRKCFLALKDNRQSETIPVGCMMSTNSNPNLFRLSLPEWLKEQVDSGKHKGVYWIDRKEKIFHVPWKHASRNGWEDGDVSLFKAWAIYTNRYREGIDKARPALWKTNFRCAINSHNSISFMKDQGQRKGDKAHRIMKLIEPPKKGRRSLNGEAFDSDPPRKLVRLTYPNFGPPPTSVGGSSGGKPHTRMRSNDKSGGKHKTLIKKESCESCTILKNQMQDVLNASVKCPDLEQNADYLTMKARFINLLAAKDHLCTNENLKQMLKHNLLPAEEIAQRPNLQDLYFVGRALQSADSEETLKIAIRVKSEMEIVDSSYAQDIGAVPQPSSFAIAGVKEESVVPLENNDTVYEEKTDDEEVIEEEIEEEVIEEVIEEENIAELLENAHTGEDDELITPRN